MPIKLKQRLLPTLNFLYVEDYEDTDVHGTVYGLPFPEQSFDLVIATELIEHLRCPDLALREIWRVLKPDGRLMLSVPFLFRVHGDPEDYFRYTKDGLFAMVDRLFDGEIIPYGGKITVVMDI